MRGRHAAELTHALARVDARRRSPSASGGCSSSIASSATFDLGRRLAGIRTRLVGADGRLSARGRGGASIAPTRSSDTSPAGSKR